MQNLAKGTVLGGFRLLGPLGSGNMGQVYLAKQVSMDRVVALKVLHPRLAKKSLNFGEMFVREARGIAQLSHPNIVAVHDAGTASTEQGVLHWFAMEYVDGETLDQVLEREHTLEPVELQKVMEGVATALAYAARKGYVHRDVKPGNIMLTRSGQVKLTDFGLVVESGSSSNRRIVGTPSYMSPEQARGGEVDFRADQYSLGCTLFHMLVGEPPYLAPTTRDVLHLHKHAAVPDPAADGVPCPEPWRSLCMRLMAKEPAARFDDPQDLIAELRSYRQRTQAVAKAAAPRFRPTRRSKPRMHRMRPVVKRSSQAPVRRTVRTHAPRVTGAAPGSSAAAIDSAALASQDLISDDSNRSRTRRYRPSRPVRALMLPFQLVGRGFSQVFWALMWLLGLGLNLLWLVGSWLLDHLIAMLPVIRGFLYWTVPHLARLAFLPSALTWRVRVHGGHDHLVEALDATEGHVALFADGRRLPFIWRMTEARFDPCKDLISRRWYGEWLTHVMERLTLVLARTPQQRAQALARRLDKVVGRRPAGVPMSYDARQRGSTDPEVVAFARHAGCALLPVACAATPAWIFRRSPQRMMIPPPFATIHLVIGAPLRVGPDGDGVLLAERIAGEMQELQRYCDRIARLEAER